MTSRAGVGVPERGLNTPLRMMFLIRSLRSGGAERQVVTLANGLAARGHAVSVAEFYSGGEVAAHLAPAVRLIALRKRHRWDALVPAMRLVSAMRRERPDIVHGYLAEPNIAALVAKLVKPSARIVWGIRSSAVDMANYDGFTQATFALARWLSRFPDAILVNSHAGRSHHAALGYPQQKMFVVANGVDTDRFQPDPEGRARVRHEWGVGPVVPLVGIVGRLDPLKDHRTFMEAAHMLVRTEPLVRFVIIGDGETAYWRELRSFAGSALDGRMLWFRGRKDMSAVYSALDVHCSSSVTEGFSNAVAEAMACGVPSVVTDVGDSAAIVGPTGVVVPCRSPAAVASGISQLLRCVEADRTAVRERTRGRVVELYSAEHLVDRTLEALVESS